MAKDNYLNFIRLRQFLDNLKATFLTKEDIDKLSIKGEDGVSISSVTQTATSTADSGTNIVTVELSDGTNSTFYVQNGSKGSDGKKGDTGENGISITNIEQTAASTVDNGINVITITLSDGSKHTFEIKNGSKGNPGNKGDRGDTGPSGKAASISIGNVTTASAGVSASVTNRGTAEAAILDFVIPKGDTGTTGTKGDTGEKGDVGTRGSQIYWGTSITGANTAAAIFSSSGVISALINDLYLNTDTWNIYQCTESGSASTAKWIYKGNIKGATGATGSAGINATTTAVATTNANGLMSKDMVVKLNGIAEGATAYTHPVTSGNKHIPSGGQSGQILRWSADGTAVWGTDNNTTYGNMTGATASAAGKSGLVPAPPTAAQHNFLRGDATWSSPFSPQVITTANTDLNNYKTAGIFFFTSAYTPVNIPIGVNGWLIVIPASATVVKQLWYRQGTVGSNDYMAYARMLSGSTWSNWKRFIMEDEVFLKTSTEGKWIADSASLTAGGSYRPVYIKNGIPAPIANILQLVDGVTAQNVLRLYDDGDTSNAGGNLVVQGSGNTFVGGGESPYSLYNEFNTNGPGTGETYTKTGEWLNLTADGGMQFFVNCNTLANRIGMRFTAAGSLEPIVTGKTKLGTAANHWASSYIDAVYGNIIGNYGTCSTAAATAAKAAAITGFVLAKGAIARVKFTVTNTAASPTLNVNSTGAKPIYYRGAPISAGCLASNRTYEFVYNGTQYELVGDINTDTNTDTKNTAGSTNTSSKLFLVGATSQAANPQTYSRNSAYVGTDGCLYSNSVRVISEVTQATEPTTQKTGDYWIQEYT